LRENGFIEGKNVIIDRRFAEGNISQYAEMVVDLLKLSPDVIVTSANNATLAAEPLGAKHAGPFIERQAAGHDGGASCESASDRDPTG
jgi:hypothetical protein